MPCTSRMLINESKTAYHVISKTALDEFPFGDVEKNEKCRSDRVERNPTGYYRLMLNYGTYSDLEDNE
jgi:hypothetical protein